MEFFQSNVSFPNLETKLLTVKKTKNNMFMVQKTNLVLKDLILQSVLA